jgi:hypothetical protein
VAPPRNIPLPLATRSSGVALTHSVFHPAGVALAIFAITALSLLALAAAIRHRHRVRALYRRYFSRTGRERRLLAATAFYLSFAIVRLIAHAVRSGVAPFHNIEIGGRHIHHMVFGILILLAIGYGWLLQLGADLQANSRLSGRAMALLYGIGAALTLDEFALWLNLEDVYWTQQGRSSVDAVLLFGTLLVIGVLGGGFLRSLAREALRPFSFLRR